MIRACIFDLDGVIVDTAKYHFLAWRRLANELGLDFGPDKNEQLKGVGRMESLEKILQWGGLQKTDAEKKELTDLKNGWYQEYVQEMTAEDILEGVLPFLAELDEKEIRKAVGSSSKNAQLVIRQIGLEDAFEVVVDGNKLTRSKPDPQVFQLAAEVMALPPAECIVFEDAASGVEAALNGGFYAVGVGKEEHLGAAHFVIPDFIGQTFDEVVANVTRKH